MGKTRSQESSRKASTTVHQCRGGPFLPVGQVHASVKNRTFTFENQWGRCTIRDCKLTQTHQDIIDTIRANAVLTKTAPDGQVLMAFCPYTVLKGLGDNGTNHSWLIEKLEDLRKIRIDTEVNGMKIAGGIVRKHAKSLLDNEAAQKRGGIAKEVKYWYVIFEAEYSKFFLFDMGINYLSLLPELIALKDGVCKALVRFCLSHNEVNMALDELLLAIGSFDRLRAEDEPDPDRVTIVTPPRTQREIRKTIRAAAEQLERDFGITIRKMKDGRDGVFYQKNPGVLFEPAPSESPVITSSPELSGTET